MKRNFLIKAPWLVVGAFFLTLSTSAQKETVRPKPAPKPVIFAVLDSGRRVEPIARIDAGKLIEANTGEPAGKAFAAAFYKSGTAYPLIFGGVADGKLSIVKSNIGAECGGGSAESRAAPIKAKLSNLVMALATNANLKKGEVGYRRRPSIEERTEIENLVRAEFTKQGTAAAALKDLRYHNLTAVDLNGDNAAEFIGSYWLAPSAQERRMLFFVAEKNGSGKLGFSVNDYSLVKPEDVMTSDVKDLDTGVGHELLLDVLDVDADGVREIFTIGQAFEGNNYHVYKRVNGKWTKVHETYSYRCAF